MHSVACPIREPKDLTDAQFSANFSVAIYLLKGGAGFHECTEEVLHDPDVWELSQRVILEIDDDIEAEWQRNKPRSAKLKVRLKSGEEFTERVDHLRLMTSDDLDQKLRTLAAVVLDEHQSEKLLAAIHSLEDVRDISAIVPMLVRVPE